VREAYENVKDQVGGCGIWCGSCAVGNGSIRAVTEGLGKVLAAHGLEHWAPPELDVAALNSGLKTVGDVAACGGCRQGGGREDCPLRVCSVERNQATCASCPEFGACGNDELLEMMRDGARRAGLFVLDPGVDSEEALAAWREALPGTWPSAVLFLEER